MKTVCLLIVEDDVGELDLERAEEALLAVDGVQVVTIIGKDNCADVECEMFVDVNDLISALEDIGLDAREQD
jgi:hypothetical protein